MDADRRLKRIARAGKEWKRTMGRKVDMEGRCCFLLFFFFCEGMLIFFFWLAYVYRLCIEWARLWADDRESMDYKL